ncbi:uncharacterized protein LOC135463541 [Liolophura sinensis]|uniref:uncharacterized protein LOC135463541 n=1 Tax=Liolophura sinensis TaxID=3198878 RepID=UPI0031592DA7
MAKDILVKICRFLSILMIMLKLVNAGKCLEACYTEEAVHPTEPSQTCVLHGMCSIDGGCHADGAVNPVNSCEQCDFSRSMLEWSPVLYELNNGKTTTCGEFCNFVQNQAPDLISLVCSYPGFVSANNFNNMCPLKDTSSLNCPAGGIKLTKYKAMCSHKTALEASADPVVCP